MKDTLRHQLDRLGLRLAELDASLADNAVASDIKRFRALSKEQADVAEVVGLYRRYLQREEDLDVAQGLLEEPDMAEMALVSPPASAMSPVGPRLPSMIILATRGVANVFNSMLLLSSPPYQCTTNGRRR
jgi:uncharacterized protein involved in exopolysaccharide biosynthesis